MIIRQPNQADWDRFSVLAAAESWRVPHSELRLFRGTWSQYAYVLEDNGFCGFVTAVAYEKSSWIGNLIVPQNRRGKGYGSHLFRAALTGLVKQGMASIWLTASELGRGIYEREGFRAVDTIERWVLPPRPGTGSDIEWESSCEKLMSSDRFAWGEDREPLTSVLCKDGKVFTEEDSVALLQAGSDLQVVGPWYAHEASQEIHRALLEKIVAAADPYTPVVVDLFALSSLPQLCEAAGFQFSGSTLLMAYGDISSIDLRRMISLASLGSIG